MRLWSLHPQYLDRQGLLALWREGLLARKVLVGGTRGYRSHPQLWRFRASPDPVSTLDAYLGKVREEAARRGYRFDAGKIGLPPDVALLEVTTGQIAFEWAHLGAKLRDRAPALADAHRAIEETLAHPLFRVVAGPIAEWERGNAERSE